MKLFVRVSAQDLLNAGAPLNVLRQSYRPHDVYTEKTVIDSHTVGDSTALDAKTIYESTGSARDNMFYYLPAKTDANMDAETVGSITKLVYGGSLKDSYVLVTAASGAASDDDEG